MVMGLGITGFATTETYNDAIRIYGVEAGADENITVTAYQIIKYNNAGYYEPVIDNTIDKDGKGNLTPTASNILTLSGSNYLELLAREKTPVNLVEAGTGDDVYYTTQTGTTLDVGTWMIIVSGSNDYIYNPAIISVNQTTSGIEYGQLNLDEDKWTENNSVFMKKSEPTIEKTAITDDGTPATNVQGVQYGDIIKFQIKTIIPSYASNKTGITYTISDSLNGLALVVDSDHPVEATLGGKPDDTLTSLVKAAFENEVSNVTVNVTGDDYIKLNGNKEIIITYYAKVTTEAAINVDKTTNTATLEYSTGNGTHTKSDDTKHYTFGIDTAFTGATGTQGTTGEFVKIDSEGNVGYNKNTGELVVTENTALSGAEFQLHIGEKDGELFKDENGEPVTFKTGEDGRLQINGLDSDVQYYLIETKAPQGYTINSTPIPVKINAFYDETTGDLTDYDVVIDTATTHYKYEDGETTLINDEKNPSNPYGFKNTTLTDLPSTGGMGTTLFTIAGCVIMISAAGLFFATRKKAN